MPYGPQTDREEDDALVRAILEIVRRRTGLDFGGYRTATIRRRIGSRMAVIGVRTLAEYERFLAGADAETVPLVERLTICLLYTSPSPRDKRQSRMPSSA